MRHLTCFSLTSIFSRISEQKFQKAATAQSTNVGKRVLKSQKTKGKRAPRYSSNIFAMFEESQIQEFKEAFNMIDQNRDGVIDKEDLTDMLASLGKKWGNEQLFLISYMSFLFKFL